MKPNLLLLLAISLILAGCIGQGPSAGAITATLAADATSVYSGTPVGITLSLSNGAIETLKDVKATITEPKGWDVRGAQTETDKIKTITAVPAGGGFDASWIITAPDVITDTPYVIFGTVNFTSKSARAATITVVTPEFYRRTKTTTGLVQSEAVSGGPISISFSEIGQLFVDEGGEITIPIRFIITNIGSGKACSSDECSLDKDLNKVKLTVSSQGLKNLKCDEKDANGDPLSITIDVSLARDGTTGFANCEADITDVIDVKIITVSSNVEYKYIQDLKSPTITVQKIG